MFSVDAQGYGSVLLLEPVDFRDFHGLGLSVEATGGSPASTGAWLMSEAL